MAETTNPQPAPVKAIAVDPRAAAVQAWFESVTDDQKRAAVAQYPILTQLYSLATNYLS